MTADELSRRAVLRVLAGSAGAALASSGGTASASLDLSDEATIYRAKYFTAAQVDTLGALAEAIIPSDEHSPGGKAAGVPAYIDTIVNAGDSDLKQLYSQGLEAIDGLAQASGGKPFTACTPTEQVAILQKLSVNEDHPLTPEDKFFVAVKRATVDGYYTSSIGIHQDLEYQGNKMIHNFIGCTHTSHEGDEEQGR